MFPIGLYDSYHDYADKWEYAHPYYSIVEIEDVERGNDLLISERIVEYSDLIATRQQTHNYSGASSSIGFRIPNDPKASLSSQFSRHVLKNIQNNKVMNPPDGAIIISSDSFEVFRSTNYQLDDLVAWEYFASSGLDAFRCNIKDNVSNKDREKKTIYEKLRISLKCGFDFGYIQFRQSAIQGAWNNRGGFPCGTIMSLYVYRGPESRLVNPIYPPVLSVKPRFRQTYVPLQDKQLLQVITPADYKIDTISPSADSSLKMTSRHKAYAGGYHCSYFKCVDKVRDSHVVTFASRHCDLRGLLVVPPIETYQGRRYAVLHGPLDGLVVYVNGIDGIILRAEKSIFPRGVNRPYIDSTMKLRVESGPYKYSWGTQESCYDLKLSIMDKTLKKIQIHNLARPDACYIT